jgi:hypothetical protein
MNKTICKVAISTMLGLACCLPAGAATLFFNPDASSPSTGAVDVVLPIDKLSSVPVPRGRININGNIAELSMIPEWQFDRNIVLYGHVLDTRVDSSGKQPIVRGVVMFHDGEWIDYFDDRKPDETIVTATGSVHGRIADVQNSNITIEVNGTPQAIPLANVVEIRSPRVFTFAIPTTPLQQRIDGQPFYSDARSISMNATSRPFRIAALRSTVSKQMDDGDLSTGKLVAIGTVLSLIELGQMVPTFAVPLGANGPFERQLFQRSLPFQLGLK